MTARSLMRLGGTLLVAGIGASACAAGSASSDGSSADPGDPGIVLDAGRPTSPGAGASATATGATGVEVARTVDPRADLDIDDQRGDGTRVVVESLTTGLEGVTLVLLDAQGQKIATLPVTIGVQPVTVELDEPLQRSQELRGVLEAPDGGGILVDDEGEAVEEDFDYVIR